MDRSHSRSASPREPARPQHRPPSPPSPPAFENRAYQHDEYDPNHNDSFNSNGPQQNGHKEPNGDSKALEAVNLELINLTPKNGNGKKKDVEVDMSASNPYDEYFVPVNEHRKYMRGEKLYVTADKRGEKGGCKRPLCWTLLGLVVAAIVALIVLAATGILFTNSPTPLEPYNASVSSARALGGITHATSLDDQDHDHDHEHNHNHDQAQDHDHAHDHNHGHENGHGFDHESNTESEHYAEHDQNTERMNQETDSSMEENMRDNDNQDTTPATDNTKTTMMQNGSDHDHSMASDEASDNSLYVPRTLEGELKIDNEEFTAALEDPESDEYREFVNTFSDGLKRALFDRSTLENGDNDIVLEVVKIRSGSIVVTYRIHWKPKYNTQNSDNLFTPKTLESILSNYLAQNNRMISIYHIAEDNMETKPVLDICQINNNDCEYGCDFDKTTLDFTCTCPHGQIQDMKHPKKCVSLLDNTEPENSPGADVSALATTSSSMPEIKPNTEHVPTEKEIMQNTFDWKQTSHQMVEITTESDADVSFSHIFGTASDDNEKHMTDISNHQTVSQDVRLTQTTPMPTLSSQTVAPEPAAEPEPTAEPKPDSNMYTSEHNLNDEPQPNPEPEPAPEPHLVPITTTTELLPTPEPQPTTEEIIPHYTTTANTPIAFENVMAAEVPNTENVTTTDGPLPTLTDSKYDLKSSYNFDSDFRMTTTTPFEAHNDGKSEINTDINSEKKLIESNNEYTMTENDWLEDITIKPQIPMDVLSNAQDNKMQQAAENDNDRATEERTSKAFSNEFYVDELINQMHTTSRYNESEIEGNTKSDDFLYEQMTKNDEQSVTKAMENVENSTTTAVSISQIFVGNKPGGEFFNNGSLDTTTVSVLTENEGTTNKVMNINENIDSNFTTPGVARMTTVNPNTEYPNMKQNEDLNMDQNLMTVLTNTEPQNNVTTEKDITETDITFDAINKLFNRTSKSYLDQEVNIKPVTETNDIFKEITETTTASDWITETVAEINYQDVINANKNPETTETSVKKIDEIISREMGKDDFEPDYLNMGSNNSKSLEHDQPLYGMLQDYDNDESVIKRVKNEPSMMIEETTKNNTADITMTESKTMENLTTLKPTTETESALETTTVGQFIYKSSSTEFTKILDTTTTNPTTVYSVPQVWENSEDDPNFNVKELPKDLGNTSQDMAINNMPVLITEPVLNSNQSMVNDVESMAQIDNVTQGNNLNVTIYEISNHDTNHSMEKSINHQSAEYDVHETEMNPFLPEIENNKSLVKKLQEGHDIEPSNVNETQNDNVEEQTHHNLDGSATTTNQTVILSNQDVMPSVSENQDVKHVEDDALLNELPIHQNTRIYEEKSQTSAESGKDMETTQSPFDQIDDDAKELSDQNESLPISTFLMDTDDLDTTNDPLDRVKENSDIKINSPMSPLPSFETTTEMKPKLEGDNEFLSVVPIEQENTEEKENFKSNYERENIPELNIISDSPKKSDRRTVESSNINSLIDNEA